MSDFGWDIVGDSSSTAVGDYLNDEDYLEPCENLVLIPEDDEWDRDPGEGLCGGRITITGGQGYYNGHYDCYTMYVTCDRCGPYEVECV